MSVNIVIVRLQADALHYTLLLHHVNHHNLPLDPVSAFPASVAFHWLEAFGAGGAFRHLKFHIFKPVVAMLNYQLLHFTSTLNEPEVNITMLAGVSFFKKFLRIRQSCFNVIPFDFDEGCRKSFFRIFEDGKEIKRTFSTLVDVRFAIMYLS
jgi:hypothetical protein